MKQSPGGICLGIATFYVAKVHVEEAFCPCGSLRLLAEELTVILHTAITPELRA